jgi:hypothetical protein
MRAIILNQGFRRRLPLFLLMVGLALLMLVPTTVKADSDEANSVVDCSLRVANTESAIDICTGDNYPEPFVPEPEEDAGVASDSNVIFDFPSADSTVVASIGFMDADEIGWFWSVGRGDLVSETFSTALGSISRAILEVEVVQNVLNSGAFVDWDLEINGVVVGSFTINEGFTGPVTVDVTFAPITGPIYDVTIRVTNEVAPGFGSHSLAYAGAFAHSIQVGGETVGGCVTRTSVKKVICRNKTTGQKVVIKDGATCWDCEAAGLVVNPGDKVLIKVTGTVE